MSDDEIRDEIARQIHETLSLLAIKLRSTAHEHGPVIAEALNLTADEIDQLPMRVA